MAKPLSVYEPISHAASTSTGTADKKTLTKPATATAMFVSVKTTNARITFEGTDPDPATATGLVFPAGVSPQLVPFAATIEFVSDVAGNSEVAVLWLR